MKTSEKRSFSETIIRRNRILTAVLVLMFIYMIVVSELRFGDSRHLSSLAELVSRIIFFGGMIYVVIRILQNRRLLKNWLLLKEQKLQEADEMNQALHEKSGGIVWDILLICQLFITLTTSLSSMPAFYSAFTTLMIMAAVKAGRYLYLIKKGI